MKDREVKPALALPSSLEVREIEILDGVLTITAVRSPESPLLSALRHPCRTCA